MGVEVSKFKFRIKLAHFIVKYTGYVAGSDQIQICVAAGAQCVGLIYALILTLVSDPSKISATRWDR